jgi:hypothetical protein
VHLAYDARAVICKILEGSMGWLDKMRTFVGNHGVNIEVSEVMKSPPAVATYPVAPEGDPTMVLAGTMTVAAQRDVTVLKHVFQAVLVKHHPDGRVQQEVVHQATHDERGNPYINWIQFPYRLSAGQTQIDRIALMHLGDASVAHTLREMGEPDLEAVFDRDDVRLELRVLVDVQGTPMDAEAQIPVRMVPSS